MFCYQVNVGCVPKKVMYSAAVHSEYIHDHSDYGFNVAFNSFDFRLFCDSYVHYCVHFRKDFYIFVDI